MMTMTPALATVCTALTAHSYWVLAYFTAHISFGQKMTQLGIMGMAS